MERAPAMIWPAQMIRGNRLEMEKPADGR